MTKTADGFVMTVGGPMSLDHIKMHALNELSVNPGSVNANDKLSLVREIERLRSALGKIADRYPCGTILDRRRVAAEAIGRPAPEGNND